jgi:hypothetical protein
VNWDAVGAVAELLGALGVIATLGYLAFQIRQNTISMRSSSHQAAVTAVSDWSRAIGLDPTAAQLVQQGNLDLGALTPERRFQFMFLTTSLYRNFENIFYQHEQGAIDEAVWQGWSVRILGNYASPGIRAWWELSRLAFSASFRAFLEESPLEEGNITKLLAGAPQGP